MQQDGLAGGGPDRAGAGDGMAHEPVDECRFPGTGGTADDGEERRLQAAVARQDVVLELGEGVADVTPGVIRAGQGQRQHGCSQVEMDGFQQFDGMAGSLVGAHRIIMPVPGHAGSGSTTRRTTKNGPGLMPGTVQSVTPAGFEPALPP